MGRKIATLMIFFLALISVDARAQTGTIKGTAIDSTTSNPLPGVNVGIQSLALGAATNSSGNFEINEVPAGQYTVTASFIGYDKKQKTVEVGSGETVEVNFQLVPTTYQGQEVVVTALGIKRSQKSLGFGVQKVSGEDVTDAPEVGVVESLAGKTAGVQITSSSGQPGSASRIVIRGANSITGNNQPLFVVDGVPISNAQDQIPGQFALYSGSSSNRALDIDPSMIKDITVLKGGSATALYGARASNGVVLITTKNPSNNFRINFHSKLRFDQALIEGTQDQYLSGEQGYFANGLPANRGGYMEPGFPGNSPQVYNSWGPRKDQVSQQVLNDLGVDKIPVYNHLKNFYQTGELAQNSINFSGGSENINYMLSASRLDQNGTTPTTGLGRTTLNAKVDADLMPNLQSETRATYVNTTNSWQRNGWVSSARTTRVWPINLQMKPYQYPDGTNITHGQSEDSPYWQVNETGFHSNVDRIMFYQKLTYDITSWLDITERVGLDKYTDSRYEHRNRRQRYQHDGSMFDEKIVRSEINSDLILNLQEVPITDKFSISGQIGNNFNLRDHSYDILYGNDQNIPDFFHISNFNRLDGNQYRSKRRLMSLYSQAVLSYNDYLFLTLTGRNDWSSTLPKSNRSYFYPSASLGFVFSDLLGLESDDPLYYGKIRASISETGNDAPVYSLRTHYNSASFTQWYEANSTSLDFPYNGVSGYLQSNTLGNPNLKPELTKSYEVGINLRFFGGRATIDADYYNETTRDQIYSTPVASGTGFTNMLRNAGNIRNKGVEVALDGTVIQSKNFSWDLTVNWSKNKNEVVSLAPGVNRLYLAGYAWPSIQAQEGAGYGIIRGYGYKTNDKGQYIIQDDPNKDGYGFPVTTDQQKTIGNIQPDWQGNLRTTFHYKGFSLSGLFDVQQGGDILNFDLNYTIRYGMAKITEQRGTQMTDPNKKGYIKPYVWDGVKKSNGEPNDIKLLRDEDFWQRYASTHENQVEDASYIKLRQVSLGYRLPKAFLSKTPLRTASITVTGRNLWIKSDFSYGDPEGNLYGTANGGNGYYQWVTPTSRSVLFNLKLGF
ncbi:MAG TPA: SusC/RagA family TonB-linked outer membrane protein [Balneolaceae bacterium]|nr:SusC/RagA family TonB-linked outer membrane protein [Balneolaceae bacterium]